MLFQPFQPSLCGLKKLSNQTNQKRFFFANRTRKNSTNPTNLLKRLIPTEHDLNKHARGLTAPGSKFEKMARFSSIVTFHFFEIFPLSSDMLTSLMESWCIVFMGNLFFSVKINLKMVSKPFISPRYKRNFGAKRGTFYQQTLFTYCTFISNSLNVKAREPLSRQGKTCFLNHVMPNKCHA